MRSYARLIKARADGRDYTGWKIRLTRPRYGLKPGAVGTLDAAQDVGTMRCRHYVTFPDSKVMDRIVLPSRHAELIPPR